MKNTTHYAVFENTKNIPNHPIRNESLIKVEFNFDKKMHTITMMDSVKTQNDIDIECTPENGLELEVLTEAEARERRPEYFL